MSSMYQLFNVSTLLQHQHSQVYGTNCLTCVLTGEVNKYGTLLYKRFTTFQEIFEAESSFTCLFYSNSISYLTKIRYTKTLKK